MVFIYLILELHHFFQKKFKFIKTERIESIQEIQDEWY